MPGHNFLLVKFFPTMIRQNFPRQKFAPYGSECSLNVYITYLGLATSTYFRQVGKFLWWSLNVKFISISFPPAKHL